MSDIKEQIDALSKNIQETEEAIRVLNDKCNSSSLDRQKLIVQYLLDNKILSGSEWKIKTHSDIPKLIYNKIIDKKDPLYCIIDLNEDNAYANIDFGNGVVLQLDDDRASIYFSDIKTIFPFCKQFEMKIMPGNIFIDLQKLIRQIKILESINHQFNFKPGD